MGSLKPHDLWDVFIHSDFIYPHVVLCCFVFFLCSFLQNRNYYVKIISPHRLFQLEPAAKSIFGFSEDENIFACEKKLDRFAYHAQHFIQMLDKALHLLGPDIEMLTDIFMEIGAKHVQYGTSCHVTSCHVTSRHHYGGGRLVGWKGEGSWGCDMRPIFGYPCGLVPFFFF